VLEGGKLVLGRNESASKPTSFTWTRHEDDADFVVGDEKSLWSDFFAREKDQLLLHCSRAEVGDVFTGAILRFPSIESRSARNNDSIGWMKSVELLTD
jgi:hypothetical protein